MRLSNKFELFQPAFLPFTWEDDWSFYRREPRYIDSEGLCQNLSITFFRPCLSFRIFYRRHYWIELAKFEVRFGAEVDFAAIDVAPIVIVISEMVDVLFLNDLNLVMAVVLGTFQ